MTQTFKDLGLNANLLETLEQLSYHEPTPIQAKAIPALLNGQDVLGQAQTGTGKTAAFTLPLLNQLNDEGLQALILTPTRELAIQVSEAVYRYGKKMDVRVLPVYGGSSYDRQIRRLKKGVHVVVGTPGRTRDLIGKRVLDLSKIRFMVFDEADEMLKMGFMEDVEAILSATPADTRQTLLFSATFTKDILRLSQNYMRNPLHIEIESEQVTADNIDQRYYLLNHNDKIAALSRLLETEQRQNTLVFTRTKVGSAELAEMLVERGYPAVAIHGDLAQNERERILGRFRSGQLNILVATDVVGRGVDINDVSHVINYDLPDLPIEYVHRIGRTGRAGRSGIAISFITPKQKHTLRKIEQYIDTRISKRNLPSVADVRVARDDIFLGTLQKHVERASEDTDFAVIDRLLEAGYDVDQVVAGMLRMLRENIHEAPLEEIRELHDKPTRQDQRREERHNRDNRDNRTNNSNNGNNGNNRGRKRRRHNDTDMVRLMLDVGKSNGIRPGDVVYSIASSANIPGSVIGAITIKHDKTLLDVPQDHVAKVLKNGNRVTIKGQTMNIVRA